MTFTTIRTLGRKKTADELRTLIDIYENMIISLFTFINYKYNSFQLAWYLKNLVFY